MWIAVVGCISKFGLHQNGKNTYYIMRTAAVSEQNCKIHYRIRKLHVNQYICGLKHDIDNDIRHKNCIDNGRWRHARNVHLRRH